MYGDIEMKSGTPQPDDAKPKKKPPRVPRKVVICTICMGKGEVLDSHSEWVPCPVCYGLGEYEEYF